MLDPMFRGLGGSGFGVLVWVQASGLKSSIFKSSKR